MSKKGNNIKCDGNNNDTNGPLHYGSMPMRLNNHSASVAYLRLASIEKVYRHIQNRVRVRDNQLTM